MATCGLSTGLKPAGIHHGLKPQAWHVHSDGNSYVPSSWGQWIDFMAGDCGKPGQLPFIRAIGVSLEMMPSTIINLVS